jgi:Glycosyltransferase family 87
MRSNDCLQTRGQQIITGLLPLLLFIYALVVAVYLPFLMRGIADFRQLYTGGYMLRTGHAYELYDYDAQQRFENSVVSPAKLVLPINHLAYEELLFAPLSLLKYRAAYLVFMAVNLGLLYLSFRLLRAPSVIFVGFLPVILTLLQGQDSILLLALLAAAWATWRKHHEGLAGALVAVGMFKFQIVIPVAIAFLLWRRWRFFAAFTACALILVVLSAWIVGMAAMHQYMRSLSSMSVALHSSAEQYRYGVAPQAMPNLRGLLVSTLGVSKVVQGVVFGLSAFILLISSAAPPSFPVAVAIAALVSYHLLGHDAVIWLIPIVTALQIDRLPPLTVAAFLAPLCVLIPGYGYLASVALIGLIFSLVGSSSNDTILQRQEDDDLGVFCPTSSDHVKPLA